jgi:hexulose-6-phosphate isomerase
MQGRLSPLVDGRIQAFPWDHWREEISLAQHLGFELIEWTLDQGRLRENPLLADAAETRRFFEANDVSVPSITGDCFMQAPFYKADGREREALLDDLKEIIDAAETVGSRFIVVPLVDGGRLESDQQAESLADGLLPLTERLKKKGIAIVFESDFPPERLARFMNRYSAPSFGINYDIGNSASLGFDPEDEMAAYAERILNVHVKDRLRGGTTVPLGTGAADLPRVFRALHRCGYRGDFILQTARAEDGDHAGAAVRYRDMTLAFWDQAGKH